MMRIEFNLPQKEFNAAKAEAERLGISVAELLRRSLTAMLPPEDSKPWMRFAGMVESGDANSSQHIDGHRP